MNASDNCKFKDMPHSSDKENWLCCRNADRQFIHNTVDAKIPFTKHDVKNYLDECIRYWRGKKGKYVSGVALYYIDAYLSVRSSIFGEILPVEKSR